MSAETESSIGEDRTEFSIDLPPIVSSKPVHLDLSCEDFLVESIMRFRDREREIVRPMTAHEHLQWKLSGLIAESRRRHNGSCTDAETVFATLRFAMQKQDRPNPLPQLGCTITDLVIAMNTAGFPAWKEGEASPPTFDPLTNYEIDVGNGVYCGWRTEANARNSAKGKLVAKLQERISQFTELWGQHPLHGKKETIAVVRYTEEKSIALRSLQNELLDIAREEFVQLDEWASFSEERRRFARPTPYTEQEACNVARVLLARNGYGIAFDGRKVTDSNTHDVYEEIWDPESETRPVQNVTETL